MFCVMPDQTSKTLSRFLLWICLAALPPFSFILEDFKFLCGQIGTTLPSQKVSYFLKYCTFSAVHWNSSLNIKPQRSKSLFQSKLKIPMLYLFVDTGRTIASCTLSMLYTTKFKLTQLLRKNFFFFQVLQKKNSPIFVCWHQGDPFLVHLQYYRKLMPKLADLIRAMQKWVAIRI